MLLSIYGIDPSLKNRVGYDRSPFSPPTRLKLVKEPQHGSVRRRIPGEELAEPAGQSGQAALAQREAGEDVQSPARQARALLQPPAQPLAVLGRAEEPDEVDGGARRVA